jgi:hypothetical protein
MTVVAITNQSLMARSSQSLSDCHANASEEAPPIGPSSHDIRRANRRDPLCQYE